jgi:uncharacterized protein YecE (DUF72 family)
MNIHIGTSGWHYKHWRHVFYPEKIHASEYLKYYSGFFDTVEINNSFYKLPGKDVLETWKKTVPDNFTFTFKANRFTTHMKKLKDPRQTLVKLNENISVIREKLGVVLFQLPPNFRSNPGRLEEFLKELSHEYKYVFEFRDRSWFNDEIFEILSRHNAAFCIYDLAGDVTPFEITADFTYIRMHGTGAPFHGKYENFMLHDWAQNISSWMDLGLEIFCYFNNDIKGFAVENALKLNEMLGIKTGRDNLVRT